MNRGTLIGIGVLLLGLLLTTAGFVGVLGGSDETQYRYEVKAEQVNENEMVNSSVEYDTLSEQEREMLFRAFKKSDHFLGGAEATVYYDEPVEGLETNEWKVVRVQGVPILMAIYGPDEYNPPTAEFFFGVLSMAFGIIVVLISVAALTPE